MRAVALVGLSVVVLAAGCRERPGVQGDAAAESPALDVAPPIDGGGAGLVVDFTVTGCPKFDAKGPSCSGAVPLTVSFVPVTSPTAGTFFWDFGDMTPHS